MNRCRGNIPRFPALWAAFLVSVAIQAASPAQTLTRVDPPPPAPDFTLPDMDDEPHRLSDLRGRPVVVNFWATWCPPCREEMPSMQRAWERLENEGVVLLAINVGEDPDTVFRFTGDYPVEFPLLFDRDGAVSAEWPVRGLPTTFIVDPDGRIVLRAIGGREWDDPALIDQVLKLRRGGNVGPNP